MSQDQEDPKRAMPTERKSMWRTPEERRMSDLTRVLEWLERRRGKKQQDLQKPKAKVELPPKANEKEKKKIKVMIKQQVESQKAVRKISTKTDEGLHQKRPGSEQMGKRVSIASSTYKDSSRKPELDIKDVIALESTQRASMFRRQSTVGDTLLQDPIFSGRRGTILRDWGGKMQEPSYERKLKTLMDKSNEPKMEPLKMLKPEEVLSCRYLRLSKNNIRTLLKLCKDAGLNMDIHPHMVESEIDSKKVFSHSSSAAT